MKLNIISSGGGICSIYHLAIELILQFMQSNPNVKISEYKINILQAHFIENKKLFDDLFDYDSSNNDDETELVINYWKRLFVKIHDSPYYKTIKDILKINKINPEIQNAVDNNVRQFGINENTLGIHVRLTDMNKIHSEYGVKTFEDYKLQIDNILSEHPNIDNFFVCSDNNESIKKIKEIYGCKYKISYLDDAFRVEQENDDLYQYQLSQINITPDFHKKLFVEILTTAKSKYFIYKISDVSNFILGYSDTITHIYSMN